MSSNPNHSSQVGLGLMLVSPGTNGEQQQNNCSSSGGSSASSTPRQSLDAGHLTGTYTTPTHQQYTANRNSSAIASKVINTANSTTPTRGGLGQFESDSIGLQGTGGPGTPATTLNQDSRSSVGINNTSTAARVPGSNSTSGRPISSSTTIHTPTARHRDATLPRLSTVTSPSGSTSTPLMIFTGSPNPSLTTSAASSPRAMSPGPIARIPSPSQHSTLHIGGSSRPTTPSRPTSFPSNVTGSVPMDRASSASKSRDSHGRQQSLTSACPPVSSNSVGSGGNGVFSASNSPTRTWRIYDWGVTNNSSRYGKEKEPSSGRSSDDDEDPRAGAKGTSALHPPAPRSAMQSILNLPSALLALFLIPITATVNGPAHHYSPTVNSSVGPSASSKGSAKRYPLLVRLMTLAYLGFSVVFFGLHVHSWATGHDSASALTRAARMRLPRDALVLGGSDPSADEVVIGESKGFALGAGVGHWAHKMAGGVGWRRGTGSQELTGDDDDGMATSSGVSSNENWGLVRRLGQANDRNPQDNPLTPMTHTYRFSKMHDKAHWDLPDEIIPFAFRASRVPDPTAVTACLYSNEAWLNHLPAFVTIWDGPVSLVFESSHSRTSPEHSALVETIAALRDSDELVMQHVNFHIVGAPASASPRTLNKTRERMIERPVAQNFHANLARFFAQTEVLFVVPDARLTPSPSLQRRLQHDDVRAAVLERGDAVVVPTFGFIRDQTGDPTTLKAPTLHELRSRLDLTPSSGAWDGVSDEEFSTLANERIVSLYETLPLSPHEWPTTKRALTSQVNTRIPTPEAPTSARFALFDNRWDLNRGPTNWYLWRKSSADPRLRDAPEQGGGTGLGLDGGLGGGHELYRVMDYDLHYAPNVVIAKRGQPWCTERFESMPSACVYQMYLSGAEMWVLPDEWTFTIEVIEKKPEGWQDDPAEKLKNSISSRLYGKFHQEACMHYGREFLSIQQWDSEKAQNLRQACARTLSTWGMGLASK